MRILRWLVLAGALAGCDTNIGGLDDDNIVEFESSPLTSFQSELVTVDAGGSNVIIDGRMAAPSPCVDLQASVQASGRDITLTINARSQNVTCPGVLGYFRYLVTLGEFNPGTYRVRVQHKDTSGTRSVYDRDVSIR